MLVTMFAWIFWDPCRVIFTLPLINRPVTWYGVLFALGFLIGHRIVVQLFRRDFSRQEANKQADKLTMYMMIGTLVGARLGHMLFYENFSMYLKNPFVILRVWDGGLASHGFVVGVLVSLFIYVKKVKLFSIKRILDIIVVPCALAGGMIRIGNFINQEILGKVSTLPWAIIFGDPIDGSGVMPRHPVQLYEALFYFSLGAVMWRLYPRVKKEGQLAGLFIMLVFIFRFGIEFLKLKQSAFVTGTSFLTMGQYLSLPMILLGVFLWSRSETIETKRG